MADRYPLVVDSSNYRIQELPSGDNMDLGGSNLVNAVSIAATSITLDSTLKISKGAALSNQNVSSIAIGNNNPLGINTLGFDNIAIGHSALAKNGSVGGSVAIGKNALTNFVGYAYTNTFPLSQACIAIGASALERGIDGYSNVAIGEYSQRFVTKNLAAVAADVVQAKQGTANVSVGNYTMTGSNAGVATGFYNTAVGHAALGYNHAGYHNVAIGYVALLNNTTGSDNVAVGLDCLRDNITGSNNTAVGDSAMLTSTVGVAVTNRSNSSALGYAAPINGNNEVQLGNSATTTYAYGAVQNRSDERDKADIRDTVLGLEFIEALRPVDYKWDYRDDYVEKTPEGEIVVHPKDGSKKRTRYHHGLIAQEVKEVLDAKGIDFGGYKDSKVKGGEDVLSLGYEEFIAPMIKAIQELKAENDALKARLDAANL